jgi:hypothetical protein
MNNVKRVMWAGKFPLTLTTVALALIAYNNLFFVSNKGWSPRAYAATLNPGCYFGGYRPGTTPNIDVGSNIVFSPDPPREGTAWSFTLNISHDNLPLDHPSDEPRSIWGLGVDAGGTTAYPQNSPAYTLEAPNPSDNYQQNAEPAFVRTFRTDGDLAAGTHEFFYQIINYSDTTPGADSTMTCVANFVVEPSGTPPPSPPSPGVRAEIFRFNPLLYLAPPPTGQIGSGEFDRLRLEADLPPLF